MTGDYRPLILAAINMLNTYPEWIVRTNALPTQVWGDLDHVMSVLSKEISRSATAALRSGSVWENVLAWL